MFGWRSQRSVIMKIGTLPQATTASLAILYELISDGVWDWDARTGYVYRSPGWYRMLGYDVDSLEGNVFTWENVIHCDDYDRVMEHFDRYINKQSDVYQIEYRCRTSNDDYIWVQDKGFVVEWADNGTVQRMMGAHRNIEAERLIREKHIHKSAKLQQVIERRTRELVEVNAQLEEKIDEAERLATTDSLTDIYNRYGFEQKFKQECARSERYREPLSLITFDIDHFKLINDQNGHAAGDKVLARVSKIVIDHIRVIDIAARWGGDEFMVLLPNTALSDACRVAEKLRELIEQEVFEQSLQVTASMGVAELAKDEAPMRLTIRADNELYASKSQGRNLVSPQI